MEDPINEYEVLNEADLDNLLILGYCLIEQGKYAKALSILLLASEDFNADARFNAMLFTIFYLQKEYKKCVIIADKNKEILDDPLVNKAYTFSKILADKPPLDML